MKLENLIEVLKTLHKLKGNIDIWLSYKGSDGFEEIGDIYLGPNNGEKFALITPAKKGEGNG